MTVLLSQGKALNDRIAILIMTELKRYAVYFFDIISYQVLLHIINFPDKFLNGFFTDEVPEMNDTIFIEICDMFIGDRFFKAECMLFKLFHNTGIKRLIMIIPFINMKAMISFNKRYIEKLPGAQVGIS